MSAIRALFDHAQLAEAAYADFPVFPNSVTEALKDVGFSVGSQLPIHERN